MRKRRKFRYAASPTAPLELKESAVLEAPAVRQINVRAAKDNLSSLLEEAARGHEIVITSDGEPKARLVPVQTKRKRFKVDWEWLRSMPLAPGAPTGEELIREERDGRP